MNPETPDLSRLDALRSDFRYGVSTAATCVESRAADPATLSVWDVFAAAPGRITDGSGPGGGPDHRTHWRRDVALLAALGVDSYRLSLSWSALDGDLPGRPAMSFYQRLADALSRRRYPARGHVDPLRHAAAGDGARRLAGTRTPPTRSATSPPRRWPALGDRVDAWVTLNSPFVHSALGYGLGIEAPGLTLLGGALASAQHQLVGHGRAVAGPARRRCPPGRHRQRPHRGAAGRRRVTPTARRRRCTTRCTTTSSPTRCSGGGWPDVLSGLRAAPPTSIPTPTTWPPSAAPLDFYGVNYYHPQWIAAEPANRDRPVHLAEPPATVPTDALRLADRRRPR